MSPQEFMVALRMWLGIPVFPDLLLHPLGALVVLSSIHMEIMSWVVVMAL